MRTDSTIRSSSILTPQQTFKSDDVCADCLYETPAEPFAFLIAGAASRIFMRPIAIPFMGIGTALLITKLVLKIFDRYNHKVLVSFTKEVCKFNKAYPKLQLITFVFALAISFLSSTAGLLAGIALGCYGGVLLDIENYKLLQQTNRRKQL